MIEQLSNSYWTICADLRAAISRDGVGSPDTEHAIDKLEAEILAAETMSVDDLIMKLQFVKDLAMEAAESRPPIDDWLNAIERDLRAGRFLR